MSAVARSLAPLMLVGASCLLTGLFLGARCAQSGAPSPSPSASTAAEVSSAPADEHEASAAPSAAPPETLRERAERGELTALKRLEGIADKERSVEDAVALAKGHVALARRDLASLLVATKRDTQLASDRATLARFFDFIEREPTSVDALEALAEVPGSDAVDLIYATWRRHEHTPVGLLARDIARTPAVRARASPALLVAIELEETLAPLGNDKQEPARRCARVEAQLSRVAADGDRRCTAALAQLDKTTGCGPRSTDDCFTCLREGTALASAKDAVQSREPPARWVLARRGP